MPNRNKIILGFIGLTTCLYFYKNPGVFSSLLTGGTRWLTETLSTYIKIG